MDTVRGRSYSYIEGEGVMGTFTMATGLGMLGVGILVLAVFGAGFLYVINYKKREDRYGE